MACKKKNKKEKINLFGLLALILAMVFASDVYALNNLMALQGTVNYGATPVNGNLTVTIWTQSTGGSPIYDSSTDYANSIVNGSFDVVLGDGSNELNLEYGQYYYMDLVVNGQDLDFNGAERKIFQASNGNISGKYIAGGTINSTHIADGSLTNSDISASADIAKSKIDTANEWLESEIPSLTNTWIGTVHASRIAYQNLLNVNSSLYLGTYNASTFFSNDSALSLRINDLEISATSFNASIQSLNSSKAATGTCASGQAVQNATSTGVQCVSLNFGNGTLTQITAGDGLSGGIITTTGTIGLNTTYTDQRYLGISDQRYNETTALQTYQGNIYTNVSNLQTQNTSIYTYLNGLYTNTTNLQTFQGNIYTNTSALQTYRDNNYANTTTLQNAVSTNASKLTTEIADRISNDSQKANTGTCPDGQVVMNTTTSGVQCVLVATSDTNNYTSGASVTGTTTKTLQLSISGGSNVSASWTDLDTDTNNYSTGISVIGTTTKTIQISRNGDSNISASFTDIDTNDTAALTTEANNRGTNDTALGNRIDSVNTTATDAQSKSTLVTAVGNWSADKTNYNTTTQLNILYYAIGNPNNFLNSTSATITGYYTNITNLQTNRDNTYTNVTNLQTFQGNIYTNVTALQTFRDNIYTNTSALQTYRDNNYANVSALQTNRDNVYANTTTIQNAISTNASKLTTEIADRISNDSQKANTGTCPDGQVVMNTTTSGVQCVVPPATPAGGSNLSIQYNLNGAVSGATYASISSEGYLNVGSASAVPTPPPSGIVLTGQVRAEETVLIYEGPNGYEKTVQPHVGEDDAIWCNPAHAVAAANTVHTCTAGYVAAIGTVTNPATSYGNVRDSMVWNVLTSAAGLTEHKALGLKWGRGSSALSAQNGGFKLMLTYYVGGYDANTVGCFGMTDEVSAYTNATNCFYGAANKNNIFVGFNKGQTTLRVYTANATMTVPLEVLDCGANFSIATATNVYRQTMYAKSNGGNISVFVQRVDDSTVPPCQYTFNSADANLPVSTVPLGWRMFMGRSNATAGTTGVVMGMNKVYISSDN